MSGTLRNEDTATTIRANKVKTQDEEKILKMDILLPNEKGTYDQTEVNRNKRHLLSVKDNPKELDLDVTKEFFLKYFKEGDDIDSKWVALKSSLSSYETTARLTSEIMDFPTTIQTYALTGKPTKDYDAKIHLETMMTNNIIPEWVSLHACVSDIGLRQLTWNTNDGYYSYNNSLSGNLFIKFQNSDDENKGTYTIKYVEKDTNYSVIKTFNETTYIDLKNSKIVSVEKTAGGVNSVNKGPIELYYKVDTDGSTPIDGGVATLEMVSIIDGEDSCFNYNCQYQNNQYNDCQYTNQFYNKNIDNKSLFRGGSTTLNITTKDSEEVSTTMYNHIKTEFEKKYGSFDTFITKLGGDLELEGGYGRKATLTIDPTERSNNKQHIKITNKGYLYKEKDTLRFKDFRLRDLVYINVTSIDSDNDVKTSEYLQEFIAPGASKSNTIKYALGIKEHFLIKNITITGSVQSNVIVRLNHIKDCFGTPISYILKEFYFYGRTNINDSHDVNILIKSDTVDEFYIDLQKIVKGKDDKEKMDTLSFSLNGIKFTDF